LSYQYITTDTSGLQKFYGLGTGREILVNADPEGRFVLLHEPTEEEVKETIKEYLSIRVQTQGLFILSNATSDCTDGTKFKLKLNRESVT
jgi:hypothetical protein